jgi:cytochrome c553
MRKVIDRLSVLFLTFVLGTICLVGCGGSSESHKPVPVAQADSSGGSGGGDLAAAIPFGQVLPIFKTECSRCHNSGSNDWTKEENVTRVARNGALVLRIGGGSMPQIGSPESQSITQAQRQQIIAWAKSITQGSPSGGGSSGSGSGNTSDDPTVIHDRGIAVLTRCTACHGANGTSVGPDIPNLSSHDKAYIVSRLTGFLAPDQPGTMPTTLKSILSEFKLTYSVSAKGDAVPSKDLADLMDILGEFFSNQYVNPSAADFATLQSAFTADQKTLYASGKKILGDQCVMCHLQSDFRPIDSVAVPMIFGQKVNYLNARLAQFRKGGGGDTMPSIAMNLSDNDVKAIVFYLSNTHPTQGVPAPAQ